MQPPGIVSSQYLAMGQHVMRLDARQNAPYTDSQMMRPRKRRCARLSVKMRLHWKRMENLKDRWVML